MPKTFKERDFVQSVFVKSHCLDASEYSRDGLRGMIFMELFFPRPGHRWQHYVSLQRRRQSLAGGPSRGCPADHRPRLTTDESSDASKVPAYPSLACLNFANYLSVHFATT